MATINVRKVSIRRKDGNPQRKITARRVVINNQVQRLSADARNKRGR